MLLLPGRVRPDLFTPADSFCPGQTPIQEARCWAEANWSMSPPVSAMMTSAASRPTPGMVSRLSRSCSRFGQHRGDPGVEDRDELFEAIDLVQVVPDHEGVMVGELSVQSLDEGRNLVAGLAAGQVRETFAVPLAGDQGLQDGAAGGADDVAEDRGEVHPGVLELLLQPLGFLAGAADDLGPAAGQVSQFADLTLGDEGAHRQARGAGPGEECGVARVGFAAPDALEVGRVDEHQVQVRLEHSRRSASSPRWPP